MHLQDSLMPDTSIYANCARGYVPQNIRGLFRPAHFAWVVIERADRQALLDILYTVWVISVKWDPLSQLNGNRLAKCCQEIYYKQDSLIQFNRRRRRCRGEFVMNPARFGD